MGRAPSCGWLDAFRKGRGVSYQQMADMTETSDGYWYHVCSVGEPPTFDRALQLCERMKMERSDRKHFLNTLFRDRLQRAFLEKEGKKGLRSGLTPEIDEFIREWGSD